MKRYTASLWMVAVLALIFGGTAFAQTAAPKATGAKTATTATTAKPKAAPSKVATGTISSADVSKLVITHKIKGKDEQTTFMLAPDATKKGPMDAGNKVSVRYHTDGTNQVATSITAMAPTTAAAKTGTKKTTGAKKS